MPTLRSVPGATIGEVADMLGSTFILGIFYVLIPYVAFQLVFKLSGSIAYSWIAAVASVPAAIFGYVRLFESVKRRRHSKGA